MRAQLKAVALSVAVVAAAFAASNPGRAVASTPQQGIDVSSYQGPGINWQAVAGAGISFAFIRAGEGSSSADADFQSNWTRALNAGVDPGAYLFFHPGDDPTAQADLLIHQLGSVNFAKGMLAPAIDVETTDNQPTPTVVANLRIMVNDVQAALGALPAIYTSPSWWDANVGSTDFSDDPLWVACWCGGAPSLPANGWGGSGYQAWQYTSSGSVPGVSGSVDRDVGNPGPPLFTGSPPPARGVVLRSNGSSGYTLDGWGGVNSFGGAPSVSTTGYWSGWDISRGIVLRSDGASGYVLDGWGGIHPFGGAPAVSLTAYWRGWDIARSIVLRQDGVSGYVLDGWGGIHPFGGAPRVSLSAYWPGWDIARSIVLRPDGTSGYVLDGWGGIHAFGGAPPVSFSAYWTGWDIARALVLAGDGKNPRFPLNSGWVLDGWGGLHPFGGAPAPSYPINPYHPGFDTARGLAFVPLLNRGAETNGMITPAAFSGYTAPLRAVAVRSDGAGGYALDGWGGLTAFAGAPGIVGVPSWPGWDIARGFALRPDGSSGYEVDGWGGVQAFGGAPPQTSGGYWPGQDVARGIALRPDGVSGYVLDEHGNLWPFGKAPSVSVTATWGTDYARAVVLRSDGVSGYVLDESGALHPFGGAPRLNTGLSWNWDIARAVALLSDTSGYVLDGWGGVHPFGGAPVVTGYGYWPGADVARGLALDTSSTASAVEGVDALQSGVLSPFHN